MSMNWKLSERNQVILILLAVVAGLFLFWKYGYQDIVRQQRENAEEREKLARSGFANVTRETLEATMRHEQEVADRLAAEWGEVAERLASFSNQRSLLTANPLRIDYKVNLSLTRSRLDTKASALRIDLSASELGMSEEVFTTDDPRTLTIQLSAVERLVDLTLDRRIRALRRVRPQSPIEHRRASDGRLVFEEYPVEVEIDVDFVR